MPINGTTWRALLRKNVESCLVTGLGMHIDSYLRRNRTPINIVYLKKTGCLVTADGSDNNLIHPERIKDYEVSPLAVIQLVVNTPITMKVEQSEDVEQLKMTTNMILRQKRRKKMRSLFVMINRIYPKMLNLSKCKKIYLKKNKITAKFI